MLFNLKSKFFILTVLLLLSILTKAQQNTDKKFYFDIIEAQAGYGFITKHTNVLDYYINGHIPNININLGKQLLGKKYWQQIYNLPEIGLGYYFAYLNNDILGNVNAVYLYIILPLKKSKKISTFINISEGISYLNNPFNIETNYKNKVIGSHINVYFRLAYGIEYKVDKKLFVSGNIGLNHYSNAKLHTPNLGINVINFNAGIKYKIKEFQTEKIRLPAPEYKKNEFLFTLAGGIKGVSKPLSSRYFQTSFIFDYYRRTSQKSKFGIGTDFFIDPSVEFYYYENKIDNRNGLDPLLIGTHISYGWIFNKVSFHFQVGVYIKDRLSINGLIYSRVGLKAYIYKNIFLNLTLKTHFAKADLLETGIGIYLYKKSNLSNNND